MKESSAQARIRIACAEAGLVMWRNNSGVLKDARGIPVRFGLGNDSAKVNEAFKSSDLIGIRPTLVTQDMVGQTIGIFTSIECKPPGWRMMRSQHELAQLKWNDLIASYGGRSGFATTAAEAALIWR